MLGQFEEDALVGTKGVDFCLIELLRDFNSKRSINPNLVTR